MASGSQSVVTFEVVFHAMQDRAKLPRWYYDMESAWLQDGMWLHDPNGNMTWVSVAKIGNQPYIMNDLGGVDALRGIYNMHGFMLIKFEHMGHSDCKITVYDRDMVQVNYPDRESDSDAEIVECDHMDDDTWAAGWTVRMSASQAKQLLYIPASFVESILRKKQRKITLIAEDDSETVCYLKWQDRNRKECGIGIGWYQFSRSRNLGKGDVVEFKSKGDNKNLFCFVNRNG